MVGRLVRASRPTAPLSVEDQGDIDRLREAQRQLSHSINLANLHDDPLRFPLRAISEIAELQLQIQIKTRQLLRDATCAADQVNYPSALLKSQIAQCFQQVSVAHWRRFAAMVGILFAVPVMIVGVIVAGVVIEAHRNTPDADALLAASGQFPTGWAGLIRQNDLPFMVNACARPKNMFPAPNGLHYCYVPLIMDGVEAKPPPLPTWSQDAAGGASR